MNASSTLGRIEVLSLMAVDIVTWGIVHGVVRCLVMHNLVRDNIVVTNLLVMS